MNLNENLHQSFLMDLLLSSAMNILYFGRMEGGDWY